MKKERVIMNYSINESISKRIQRLNEMSKRIDGKIKSLPEGKLKVKRYKGSVYYYQIKSDSDTRYLNRKDHKLTEDLLQKEYLEQVFMTIKQELSVLTELKKSYPKLLAEDVYENLKDERKAFVKPIVLNDEQFVRNWLESPYTRKPISKDVPIYMTLKGERVRSKSEMIIADRLFINQIPYKYECPVLVGENEIIHPDFTILRLSDRKIIYYEHCGRMDDPGYAEDMVDRANKFALAEIIQGKNLFYTFETSDKPLDVRVLDNMINRNFR